MNRRSPKALVAISLMACLYSLAVVSQTAAPPRQVVSVSASEMSARLLTSIAPEYHGNARKCSSSIVTLDALIGEDGKVKSVTVLSGIEELNSSALAAVHQWTYRPYLLNGIPMTVETRVLIFYPGVGSPGPFFVPNGNGGYKIASFPPLPPECKQTASNAPAPSQ